MDSYESNAFLTDWESRYYALEKRRFIDLGRRYMRGEATVQDVAAALSKPPAVPYTGCPNPVRPYAGFTRYSRLVRLGCWLAQRDGSALPRRGHYHGNL